MASLADQFTDTQIDEFKENRKPFFSKSLVLQNIII
jgi:hypothetical protein